MERIESTTTCDYCGTENRLTAVGVRGDDPIRCSHCGTRLGTVSELIQPKGIGRVAAGPPLGRPSAGR